MIILINLFGFKQWSFVIYDMRSADNDMFSRLPFLPLKNHPPHTLCAQTKVLSVSWNFNWTVFAFRFCWRIGPGEKILIIALITKIVYKM